jgi:hypothetical protein
VTSAVPLAMRRGLAPLLLGLALSGCGLFDIFDDEPPSEPIPFYSVSVNDGRTLAGTADGRLFVTSEGQPWVELLYLSPWPIWSVYQDDTTSLGVGGPYFATYFADAGWLGWNTGAQTELATGGACLDAWWVGGAGGYAARSTDGTNWFPVQGISVSSHIVDLSCGPSFVLFASYAQTSGYWTSVDGSSATNVTSPADTCSVTHANGSFYALATDGRVFQSPDNDANTWTEIDRIAWPELVPWCTIRYGENTFCVQGDGTTITCCDADFSSCVELEQPCPFYDFDMQADGVLQAVGPDGCFLETQCSDGACEPPEVTTATFNPDYSSDIPLWEGGGGGDGDGDTGSCDPCTTDADCAGVAQRHGAAGAACGGDGLCYGCYSVCDGMGQNCQCITCAEGCGAAVCTGGTLCTFMIDGLLPCE